MGMEGEGTGQDAQIRHSCRRNGGAGMYVIMKGVLRYSEYNK